MKYTGPKARRCRRFGMNLYGADKYDKAMQHKPFTPGKNAKYRAGRDSEYAKQLKEKNKAREMYVLSEKQFKNMFKAALKVKSGTGEAFVRLLERRLDNTLFRCGFAMTRLQSRQFAGHGLFSVNGHRVTAPSYKVEPGDKITVRTQTKDSPMFTAVRERHEKFLPPKWLKVDAVKMEAEVIALPEPADAEQAVDMRMIVEFYSRN